MLEKRFSLRNQTNSVWWKFNSLSPNSDQYQISPRNIKAYLTSEDMRIKDMITQGEFSWYFNNFFPVFLKESVGTR